jgi:protoheme ferro-lyase
LQSNHLICGVHNDEDREVTLLQERLRRRVYVAMRNWKPFIPDVEALDPVLSEYVGLL